MSDAAVPDVRYQVEIRRIVADPKARDAYGNRHEETVSMTRYYDPRDIAHLPDSYPKLRYRALGPFASSVMLLASKVPLYTEAERETEWFKKLESERP